MDKIEKLKAEIKRLKSNMNDRDPLAPNQKAGYLFALADVLSFLSTLESEKPTTSNEDLNFALDKYIGDLDEELQREGCTYEFDWDDITEIIREVGNHFAKWGADHAPLPEDTVIFNKGIEEGKRLMMEEAVEAEVMDFSSSLEPHPFVSIHLDNKKYRFGDTVRIIVLKAEEEKK